MMMMMRSYAIVALGILLASSGSVDSFSFQQPPASSSTHSKKMVSKPPQQQLSQFVLASTIFVTAASSLVVGPPAFADEIGRETEAPTLFTGESVMICKKRGPLGACQEQVERTEDNYNDKAQKYFADPSQKIKDKEEIMRASGMEEPNEFIAMLKQRTEDNKERNDQIVKQRTMENDEGASFGPFSRQVLITNANGNGFTLLENPQAMRLKKAGFIEGKKFIKQPTEEDLEKALEAESGGGIGGVFKGIFGGGDDM